MLLRLARFSLWLAAVSAALALCAPAGHESLWTALSAFGCLTAVGLWRSTARLAAHAPAAAVDAIEPAMLDGSALGDATVALVRAVAAAPDLDAALHATARVLRSELGAAAAQVHEIHASTQERAILCDLVEAPSGFRSVSRAWRLDGSALATALRSQRAVGTAPGAAAIPVLRGDGVVAVVALTGIDLSFEPRALADLLELARERLSEVAARVVPDRDFVPVLPGPGRAKVLVVQDTGTGPESPSCMLRHLGCQVSRASGMLDGLNALRKTQFDLIPVDLPEAGADAADAWTRWGVGPEGVGSVSASATPVVALAVANLPKDETRRRDLGFDDHLTKPYRRSQLGAMLNRHPRPHAPADRPDPVEGAGAGAAVDAVLDAAALARLGELDPTGKNRLVDRVLAAFQSSVARLRPQLQTARGTDDWANVRLVAHTLKSSSASIGALRLSQLCAEVETAVRQAQRADASQLDALERELDVVLGAIARLLEVRA